MCGRLIFDMANHIHYSTHAIDCCCGWRWNRCAPFLVYSSILAWKLWLSCSFSFFSIVAAVVVVDATVVVVVAVDSLLLSPQTHSSMCLSVSKLSLSLSTFVVAGTHRLETKNKRAHIWTLGSQRIR